MQSILKELPTDCSIIGYYKGFELRMECSVRNLKNDPKGRFLDSWLGDIGIIYPYTISLR